MKHKRLFIAVLVVAAVIVGGLTTLTHALSRNRASYPPLPTAPDLQQLYVLTNQDRQQNGERPLVHDPLLDASAAAKCADMVQYRDYDHNLPDGTTWYSFIQTEESYLWAGENLAYGSYTAATVNTAWMNSPEHRANILNPKFTNVGFADCRASGIVHGPVNPNVYNDGYFVIEHFTEQ